MGFLSTFDRHLGVPLELQQGWGGGLSSCKIELEDPLKLQVESWTST